MKYLSLFAAFCILVLFLYVAFVAIVFHLVPHFVSSELNPTLVWYLVADAVILQFLAWIYKRLPTRPKGRVFT